MKILDPINEQGHQEFNKEFAKNFKIESYVILNNFNKNHFKSLINHFSLLKKADEGDVFLIFNNFSLFLLSFFFRNKGVRFVVHNNLDFAVNGKKMHYFFFKRIAKKYHLIYIEKRLKKISHEYFNHLLCSDVILHPILNLKVNMNTTNNMNNVFVSGRNLTESQLKVICNRYALNRKVICNKKFHSLTDVSNLNMGFISDFDATLQSCSRLYLIGNYKYRASGILYKFLSMGDYKHIEIVFEDFSYYTEIKSSINSPNIKLIYMKNEC